MKLRDSLAENNSILLQAEASTWQEAVKLSWICWLRLTLSSRVTTRPFWMAWRSTALTL